MRLLRLELLATLAFACLGCASSSPNTAAQSEYRREFVYVRGPGQHDCNGEVQRARAHSDASALFFAEFTCRVHRSWRCPSSCRGNELLVSHLALQMQSQGQLVGARVIKTSDNGAFDEMSVAAVRAGAPFPAPPPQLLDRSDTVAFNIEFVCDCARR